MISNLKRRPLILHFSPITQIKKWIWYGLYIIVCAGILLIVRFPGDELADALEAFVARANIGIEVAAQGLHLDYPLGVGVKHLDVKQVTSQDQRDLLVVENLSAKAEPLSLLFGNLILHLGGDFYDGKAKGVVQIIDREIGSVASEFHVHDIRAEQVQAIQKIVGVNLSTPLSGDLMYEGKMGAWHDGIGSLDLTFGKGTFGLVKPLFGFTDTLRVENMTLISSLNSREMQTKLSFTGPELTADMTGRVRLRDNLMQSELNFKGKITGTVQFLRPGNQEAVGPGMAILKKQLRDRPISFLLLGTVAEPRVRIR